MHRDKIAVLQNKIVRACLFCPLHYPTNMLYSKFGALRLEDLIKMKFAKFVFKLGTKRYLLRLINFSLRLQTYITTTFFKKLYRNEFYQRYVRTNIGQTEFNHICLHVWKNISLEDRNCSFTRFKKELNKDVWLIMSLKPNLS